MAKTLVLAEKPSVARDIARSLGCTQRGNGSISGDRYIVTWALGHLVTLADPEAYNNKYKTWNMDDLPMQPGKMKLVVIRGTSKQFNAVQSLMRRADVSELVIATDSGREGELVARWIMQKAGWEKPTKRLWISSQTDRAIKEGFSKLRPASEYDNLYKSAQARAEADWLVGLNITRALTCKYNAQLSAGRVQTPTLAMLVDREEEIKNFVPRDYWTVQIDLDGYSAIWRNQKGSQIFDKTTADSIISSVKGQKGILASVKREYKHQAPPAAYDLTELQRDANKKYAYTAKQTLSYMQSLYENHKALTYPRTDSRYITDDVAATLTDRLRCVSIGNYREQVQSLLRNRPLSTKYIVNNAKVTDHHAIIPTDEPVNMSRFSPEERNIFDLVVRRFIAVLSPAFEYEETKVKITVGKNEFHAKGKIVKNLGWKAAYGNLSNTDGDPDDEPEQSFPQIRQGDAVKINAVTLKPGKTKPPARYNEATLLTAMESPRGALGTPATRADIIEKLFSSFYAERRGKEIIPTSKGIQLVGLVPEELRSAELTAKWEDTLSRISKGQAKDSDFIAEMRTYSAKLVERVKTSSHSYVHDNMTREKCPDCGKFLLDVKGKRGKMLVCPDRECGYRKNLAFTTNARCPNCHKKLEMRGEGDNRIFTCVCGHRERLSDFEKRKKSAGATKSDVREYLSNQPEPENTNSALAEQLAKWKEKNR